MAVENDGLKTGDCTLWREAAIAPPSSGIHPRLAQAEGHLLRALSGTPHGTILLSLWFRSSHKARIQAGPGFAGQLSSRQYAVYRRVIESFDEAIGFD